jgi:hypothetical protein
MTKSWVKVLAFDYQMRTNEGRVKEQKIRPIEPAAINDCILWYIVL